MPIKVICTNCGGTGKKRFLEGVRPMVWGEASCLDCKGTGRVEELSFEEKKELENAKHLSSR